MMFRDQGNCHKICVAIGLFMGGSLGACQAVLGDYQVVDQADSSVDSSLTDAKAEGDTTQSDTNADVNPGCELPSAGKAALRMANLVTSSKRYDYCIKPTSSENWAIVAPVFSSSGNSCPKGLRYKELSAPIHLEPGSYDVAMVEGGATNCANQLASVSKVVIEDNRTVGINAFGDGTSAPVLKAMAESLAPASFSAFRFVHGLSGISNLDCGVGVTDKLPIQLSAPLTLFSNVAFGSVAQKNDSIDSNGYHEIDVGAGKSIFAVAPTGDPNAILISSRAYEHGDTYSIYALGKLGNSEFPPEVMVCDEHAVEGVLTRCSDVTPTDFTVDIVNTLLNGVFAAREQERRPEISKAIAALNSDVVCVNETWDKADRDAIALAAKSKFQYSVSFQYNLDTPVNDPTDANGDVVPEWTNPPCEADAKTNAFALLDCIRDTGSTTGDESGLAKGMVSFDNCKSPIAKLLVPSAYACWSSLLSLLPSETIGYTRSECSTNPKARLAFRGDSGVILLSKRPIKTAESWVLPGAESRISVIRAPIQLTNDSDIDVYCTQFTLPGEGFSRPYGGAYGNGKTGAAAFQEELKLQAKQLISFVNARSRATGTRAIVAGTFYAGPASAGSGDTDLAAFNVEAYNLLTAGLGIAVPFDYVPSCTECFNNPIVNPPPGKTSSPGRWTSYSLLANIARTSVRQAQVILAEPVLQVQSEVDGGAPYSIPISPYYGMRTVVSISQ